MRKYYVTVNGHRYQVEVEEVKGDFETEAPVSEVSKSIPTTASASNQAIKNISENGEKINCPMPGTIVSVNIKEGQTVEKGDLLFVLEAMKMENEIVSPISGTIAAVAVTKGQNVDTEDILTIIQ